MKNIIDNVFLMFGNEHNCNGYLIVSEESLLIDTGLGKFNTVWGFSLEDPLAELVVGIKNTNIKNVVLTHAHLDHSGGIFSLENQERSKIFLHCHSKEKIHLEEPDLRYIDPVIQTKVNPIHIDNSFSKNDSISVGNLKFKVLHTPGHTAGSICLFEEEKKWLFSGDCVFPQGSFGRVDFPGSNPDEMIDSLEMLSSLEVNALFAGHMDPVITNAKKSIEFSFKNAKSIL